MAPSKTKQIKKKKQSSKPKVDPAPRLTLEELDAISSDDDGENGPDDADNEWNAEALALRQAIKEGAFDRLLQHKLDDNGKVIEAEMEEASLDDDADDEEEEEDEDEPYDDKVENDDEEEEEAIDAGQDNEVEKEADDASSTSEDDDSKSHAKGEEISRKALSTATEELIAAKREMPWVETFSIIPPTPLPFENQRKKKSIKDAASHDNDIVDVHDDLKRELAFYNMALEAVGEAKAKCKEGGVPFSRPTDFFAEMVKTDDHMAKVKDRLIFENKKMEAVAQRKSNKEQKLRVRETHDNKLAEKAKRKREHERAVEDWAKSSHSGAGSADDLKRGDGPNKKRLAADRKYGRGGKKGRFKQNDRKSMDDMSSFNPRGNFAGGGTKRTRSSSSGKGGSNRPGKRARDAGRSRRST